MDRKRLMEIISKRPQDVDTSDILNTPIRRGGILPVTEYPDRTEFDLSSGLTGALMDAFTAPDRARRGEISEDQMVPEAFNFAGSLTLGSLLAPRPTGSVGMGGKPAQPQGIRAFHGSPHDFDRFSMDAIGTGEGAQAYGHGLYFADAEDVARSYRDALQTRRYSADGQRLPEDMQAAAYRLMTNGNDPEKALSSWLDDTYASKPGDKDVAFEEAEMRKQLAELTGRDIDLRPTGKLYEVNIKANPEDFLDWDKPLSQQSEKAREAALSAMERASGITRNDLKEGVTGADAVRYGGLDDPNAMTNALREAGIPGIRYLDQMSRGEGKGSSNYVVFDDALIEILRKYGLLPPVAAGAAASLTQDDGEVY